MSFRIRLATSAAVDGATLRVGDHRAALTIESDETHTLLSGELRIENAPQWWPHTHGTPTLLTCGITVSVAGSEQYFDCPDIGFRRLESITQDGGFGLRINDVPVFCRGACWTVSDIFTMTGTPEALEHDLRLARDAGVNMLRIGGTMAYESDEFYSLCDRLGILVWQDFAFANMDYPVLDASYRRNIEQEAIEQLQRLASHPCVAVYCGSSEIEQQAAMLGMPREIWTNDWFAQQLPDLCAAHHPGTAYVPSTPTGGALPFHPGAGLTHYYGVGAYLRTIDDVRRAEVRFTPECLGFSHLPENSTVHTLTGGLFPAMHSPKWKQRIPRDTGAGWDFEDVRDHYLRELFNVDPVELRSRNLPRYLQLGRIATGEMMARTFSEWRSQHSRTQGALVWFYKDLWPGAGWGIVDSTGLPKAAYYALKRVWNSRQLTLTDEGLNGLHLHLTNETDRDCAGFLEIELLREPNITIAKEEIAVSMPARSRQMFVADDILGRFYDVSYAYRFGPPQHDVVLATWFDDQHRPISEAVHLIQQRNPLPTWPVVVESSTEPLGNGQYQVHLQSDSFLHAVQLTAAGYLPSDNYFPLGPNRRKAVTFRPIASSPPMFRAEYDALNLNQSGFIPDGESHG